MLSLLLHAALATDLDAANTAYVDGDYATASTGYQALIDAGHHTGDLYYNLGNARYRNGELGPAIHAWRLGELLAPRDGDLSANLDRARRETRDRLESEDTPGVLFWRSSLSLREQQQAAAVLFGLLGLVLLGGRLRRDLPVAIPILLLVVPLAGLGASISVELDEATTPGAVVLADAVELRSAAGSDGGVVVFELHEGAEVVLVEELGTYAQVALPDGRRGWMRADDLAVLRLEG